ncbi:iron-containing alcohol dehydrogenase [bacterium]|nr:iron-containing alcohol dehydrogenase [candidate division CSSED10-310 bacterium]
MKANFTIQTIPETKFGCESIGELPGEIAKIGGSGILLVIDREMKEAGLTSDIQKLLASLGSQSVFVIEEKVLTLDGLQSAWQKLDPDTFDVIIAYGGWRCTDLAKVIGIWTSNRQVIETFSVTWQTSLRPGKPVVSIPTTPPNGAEIDTKVLVRDTSRSVLVSLEHPDLLPRLTVIDPELMLTLPRDLTVATGIDAIGHGIDALISINASPFSEILALQSLAMLLENIQDAFRNGQNLRARYNMAFGSMLSAIALNMTGSGAIHALAYPLTALFGISHAQASAIMTLYVIRYNLPVVPSYFTRIARILGCEIENKENDVATVGDAFEKLFRSLDQPLNLSSYNVQGMDIQELTTLANAYQDCLERNPRILDVESISRIYRTAF